MNLADMPYKDGIKRMRQSGFGGLNERESCAPNEFKAAGPMTLRNYPYISPPGGTKKVTGDVGFEVEIEGETYIEKYRIEWYHPTGMGLFYIARKVGAEGAVIEDKAYLLRDWQPTPYLIGELGEADWHIGETKDTFQIYEINGKLCIFPWKKYYDGEEHIIGGSSGEDTTLLPDMEMDYTGDVKVETEDTSFSFPFSSGDAWMLSKFGLRVGDTVQITGNETTIDRTIREISDYTKLVFDNNSLADVLNHAAESATVRISIRRVIPDLERGFVLNNRLWGFIGNTIYCSVLGNPMNFSKYDGLATDAWTVEVQSTQGFTDCASYSGKPIFLARDRIVTVSGRMPSEFSTTEYADNIRGCSLRGSAAVVGGYLFYVSEDKVCRWSGGAPVIVSDEIKIENRDSYTKAGSSGDCYVVTRDNKGTVKYDPRMGMWLTEEMNDLPKYDSRTGTAYGMYTKYTEDTEDTEDTEKRGNIVYRLVPESDMDGALPFYGMLGMQTMQNEQHKTAYRLRVRLKVIENGGTHVSASVWIGLIYDDAVDLWDAHGMIAEGTKSDGFDYSIIGDTAGKIKTAEIFLTRRDCDHFNIVIASDNCDFTIYSIETEYKDGGNY